MGLTISSLFQQLFGKKQMRILMVGLDAAGQFHLPSMPQVNVSLAIV